MTILLVGLVAFFTGGVAFRFAWRYWTSIQDRDFIYWVSSAAAPVIALFTSAVLIAGLGVLGIPFAFGMALWIATIFAVLHRSAQLQRQLWTNVGERTIDSLSRRHQGEIPTNMSFLVKLFRFVSGDTKRAGKK